MIICINQSRNEVNYKINKKTAKAVYNTEKNKEKQLSWILDHINILIHDLRSLDLRTVFRFHVFKLVSLKTFNDVSFLNSLGTLFRILGSRN